MGRARLVEPPRQREIMTVFDEVERRTVAKAMYKPGARVWLLHIYNASWLALGNRSVSPLTGKASPEYVIRHGRPAAKALMQELVDQINSA